MVKLTGARTIFARLQGEDKPSPLLCYGQVATSSIVGAMACPRPARATASFTRICARCNNRTRTLKLTICLDSRKFLRIHNDTNGLNPLCLHFNGQHEIGSITGAKDQCQLTIDCCQLNTGALW